MNRPFLTSSFNMYIAVIKLCILKVDQKIFMSIKPTRYHGLWLFSLLIIATKFAIAVPLAVPIDTESSVKKSDSNDQTAEDEFRNDVSVLMTEEEIKDLKSSYISPYNYLQDPIDLNMGYASRTDSPNGAYKGGFSAIAGGNHPINRDNMIFNTEVGELWGQTGRLGGFALGGGVTTVFNVNDNGHAGTFATTGQIAPTQAYLNYQYRNKVDVSAGNILITTPWVNSFGSAQGGTYAMGNNSYQGALVNVQALHSLLLTGFTALGYLQYPNGWYGPQNFYNTMGGILSNSRPTSGTTRT